jgi:hypothetical protein
MPDLIICFCSGSRDRIFWSRSTGGTKSQTTGRRYRRVALETLGANNLISDHTIVRAHDRAQPMMQLRQAGLQDHRFKGTYSDNRINSLYTDPDGMQQQING